MAEGEGGELQEQALLNLLAGIPEAERPRLVARLLDEVERVHRAHGAEVPGWVAAVRERYPAREG